MNTQKETTYHHGDLKEALVREALVMVESGGVNSITLRELTKTLGTSRSAIYRHYESKDALVKAVIMAGFEKLENAMLESMKSQDDVLTRLYTMGEAYMEFALGNPNQYRMIFGDEVQEQREESCDINDEETASGFHALVALIAEGQEKNIFREGDAFMQATFIWSNIHGLTTLYLDGHLHIQENIKELFAMSYDGMINGLKKRE